MDWHGVLAVEGKATKDGRILQPNALVWDNLPLPLLAIETADTKGNAGARIIGRIDHIFREGPEIRAEGILDTGNAVLDIFGELQDGRKVIGGIDVDDMLAEASDKEKLMVFTHARLRAFTLYIGESKTKRGPAFGHSTWIREGKWDEVPVEVLDNSDAAVGVSAVSMKKPVKKATRKKKT